MTEPIAVVVVDVRPSGPVDQRQVEGLTSLLTSEVASIRAFRVISSGDVRDMLGLEAQRQLLGCDDSGCLAEIGGALGAPYMLSSEVARFGESWLFTLVLIDLQAANPVSRITVRKATEEQLLDEVGPSIQRVFAELLDSIDTSATASRPAPSGGQRAKRGRVLSWSTIGAGAVALAGGSVVYGTAFYHHGRMVEAGDDAIYRRSEVDAFQRNANLGLGFLVGGAAIVGTGVVLHLLSGRKSDSIADASRYSSPESDWRLMPLALSDGGGVVFEVATW